MSQRKQRRNHKWIYLIKEHRLSNPKGNRKWSQKTDFKNKLKSLKDEKHKLQTENKMIEND